MDSPFSRLDAFQGEIRRTELRGTFSSLMTYVRTNSIDMLLIAGDLFDSRFVTKETVSILLREFSRVPRTKIIISPGNHDPYTPQSVYAKADFPDNVYIFKEEEQTCFEFPELNTDVYGFAFTSENMSKCPLHHVRDNGRLRLLCAHADMRSPISSYCPVSPAQLEACGFDYAALGHVHNAPPVAKAGDTLYGYCGCIEGRGFDETGAKGVVMIDTDKGISVHRKSFSHRRYEVCRLPVTSAQSSADVADKIRELIRREKYTDEVLLRVILEGAVSPSLVINPEILAKEIDGLFFIEIKDETLPFYDSEYLENEPTVRGEFYRLLLPQMQSADEKTRDTAARALRCGLAAMAGENIE